MQEDVIEFLSSPNGHPGGGPVEIVQTHGAIVFLAGDVALKIKRAVRYDYMDLSTLDRREAMLRRELALNRPVAPKIYQEVMAVTRSADGGLELDGAGPSVEWVLRMWRFPAKDELAVIAKTRGISDALAADLGVAISDYHDRMPARDANGSILIKDILDELDRVFAGMAPALGRDLIVEFHDQSHQRFLQDARLLDQRASGGQVRRCHGDLHLRNLVLLDGKPVPFDALEFDEVLGTCDVLYDLAFLIMDLRHRGLNRAANIVLNAYLFAASGDQDDGLSALGLFMAVRAAIRAMVQVQTADASGQTDDPEALRYLEEAIALLSPSDPAIVVVAGLSGSGKTTIARAIAPLIGAAPGAVHLRSDLERKPNPPDHTLPTSGGTDYSANARNAVYARMMSRAEKIVETGHSVLLDATFLNPENRREARRMARRLGAAFLPLWLEAPLSVMIERVGKRVGDASDADESVVRRQFDAATSPKSWPVLNTQGGVEQTCELAARALDLPQS